VTHLAFATALACVAAAMVLACMAWRRLGVARQVLRARESRLDAPPVGPCKLAGTLVPVGATVSAPFTDRPALYVRAVLYGQGPGGGPWGTLWEKTLVAPARLVDKRGTVTVDLAGAQVLVPRQYRQGTLRGLVPDVPTLPRMLARAGYASPPPSAQFFRLEEEVLAAGQRVIVLGEHDGRGTVRRSDTGVLVVSDLNPWRIVLRVAWGPALALLLAAITLATGATVVGTWWWLR
jgi:hypothetical protein